LDPSWMHLDEVCRQTSAHRWGGRVAVGHVTKLSAIDRSRLAEIGRRLADAGVAVTVLPATDLFLMGRGDEHHVPRGVAPAHRLIDHGVTSPPPPTTPPTRPPRSGARPLGRVAIPPPTAGQTGGAGEFGASPAMTPTRRAGRMTARDYGTAVGHPADLIVLDSRDPAMAVAE